MRTPNTLTLRLLLTSSIWVVLTLIATGMLLVHLFRSHLEQHFDAFLFDQLQGNIAASDISPTDGTLRMTWSPSNLRFHRPLSGWYWQIKKNDRLVARSRSLWNKSMTINDPVMGTGLQHQTLIGPAGRTLRALVEKVTLPDFNAYFTFAVAGPLLEVEQDVQQFSTMLMIALAALGAGLLGAIFLQIHYGLQPLRQLRQALAETRAGRISRLPGNFPVEIQPVVSELNALLDHNTALLDRARTQTANLAHALKNPLTAMKNEAQEMEGDQGQIMKDQLKDMTHSINRYLSKARTSGAVGLLRNRINVGPIAQDLRFSMDHLYKEKALSIDIHGLDDCYFQGDAHDLEEMLGNLLDNACKWAKRHVRINGERQKGGWSMCVEDDGLGISQGQMAEVLKRGRRLDEATPGHGLGLSIVHDIIVLYGGSLSLSHSSLGGARACLQWPEPDRARI
ncbi:MAG: HAMP domain-containing histidine kinase [Nitrospirales bacterium]|nr:HAMP domain-containing histidine kinase [Nitrospira sp.]MDR4500638.1 HAMP domain-containing histidine kinase [Nitrospirales bacterium]